MATMSKRAQARTERELQDLLKVPGNSTCADCGARNPNWASWSLGIFICMRCATIHRKLGTHISKVKSLSMDTWSSEQVEAVKKSGNTAVNQIYNPTNKKPDMPLDADEVDNAMERFIRKKYQEKSLASGKPPVPSRDDPSITRSRSPDIPPPSALPSSKKSKFFGFGLRASSSAYPFSKHDKKKRNEPTVDSAFRISSEDYTSSTRMTDSRPERPERLERPERQRAELSEQDIQAKIGQLNDMGFTDNYLNTKMLKKANGDVERTIEALVKFGPSDKPPRATTPKATQRQTSAPSSTQLSNNPFDQLDQPTQQTGFGLSFGDLQQQQQQQPPPPPQQQQPTRSNTNPWETAIPSQAPTGLEQSFASMQVNQPLFPHHTGGYNPQLRQDPRYQQSMTPPVPSIPQSYSANTTPMIGSNPFMQQPMSSQSTGNNPYAAHIQSMPTGGPPSNPFLQQQGTASSQQMSPSSLANPFGLPPSQSPPMAFTQPNMGQPPQSIFDAPQQQQQSQTYQNQQYNPQSQFQGQATMSNHQYSQPQNQYQQQQLQQQSQQQSQPQLQQQQQSFKNPQPPYNNPYQQQPTQALSPQQTGRYAKNDIMALFNYPTLAPQQPLASIPEPGEMQSQQQQYQQQQPQAQQQSYQPPPQTRQPLSQAPSNVYANPSTTITPGKRSATMPIQTTSTNRNPFLQASNSTNSSLASTPVMPNFSTNPYQAQLFQPQQQQGYGMGAMGMRHASADSVSVNNPNLMDGRHSPDVFANLSARSIR